MNKVIVDTCVWSASFRKAAGDNIRPVVAELSGLIKEFRAVMLGPIRQEVLIGVRDFRQFKKLRDTLRAFPDLPLGFKSYERAAELFNICRGHGIQGSNTDFLICAASVESKMSIFTTDKDFALYGRYIPIRLHKMRKT